MSRPAAARNVGAAEGREGAGRPRVCNLLRLAAMANRADVCARRRWLLLAALIAPGCYVSAPIKPSELVLLDGYHDGAPKGGSVSVLSTTNRPVEVAKGSEIYLDVPEGTYGGTFSSIQVSNGTFSGVTNQGQTMQVPLTSIQSARVREPNPAAWVLVALGLAAGALFGVIYFGEHSQPPVTGRALRVARRVVAAPAVDGTGWETERAIPDASPLSPEVRGALARLWMESARGEHASVPAFSRLSLSLVALGAPARLVEAAHRAALEEIEHARLGFSFASAYAGEPVGPGPLPELQRASAVTATSLAALAAESLIDGCLLEGVAAEVARRALFRARDRQVRAALAVIARDEASHAELAWDVVQWCCERGGEGVRRRLTAALGAAPASMTAPRIPEALADVLADHGWLSQADWDDARRTTAAAVAARVASAERAASLG